RCLGSTCSSIRSRGSAMRLGRELDTRHRRGGEEPLTSSFACISIEPSRQHSTELSLCRQGYTPENQSPLGYLPYYSGSPECFLIMEAISSSVIDSASSRCLICSVASWQLLPKIGRHDTVPGQ